VRRGTRALPLGSPKQRALLGFLLLHANELVPRDRLIEELWGDAAPATVNAVLSVYLSRVRRLLADGGGDDVLATQAPGYVLRVPADRLDARRFEDLVDRGRRALAAEDHEQATATLREALALWRGPALADLAHEEFAQREIGRLEELRLAALEDRIEADLVLGRHEGLVAELEPLVAEHPYRERLHAQLMRALYRSGRQAEALEAYQRARRALVEELGIAPGPRLQELERAILRHDPSLEAPEPRGPAIPHDRRPEVLPRNRRSRARLVGAVAAALAVALAVSMLVARSRSTSPPTPLTLVGNSVAVIDPATGSIADEIPVGGRPSAVAVGFGSVWAGNRDDQTLLRIDPKSRKVVRTIGLGAEPTDLAVGAGGVWVLSHSAVRRVDPAINDVVTTLRLPPRDGLLTRWYGIEVGAGAVWVFSFGLPGALLRIDAASNSRVLVHEGPLWGVAYGEGALWAVTGYEADTIERIEPSTSAVLDSISSARVGETSGGARGIAAGAGAVWPTSGTTLWKLDPASGRFTGSVPLGREAQVTADDRAVWAATSDGNLLRIDPELEKVVETLPLGVYVSGRGIAVGEGAVWLATTS
jgi:YVTN family beta-propeller protein